MNIIASTSKANQDCFHFESDILQYFQWRISTIVEERTGTNSDSRNDDNAPTPDTTATKALLVPKRKKNDPVEQDVTTTKNDDDQPNIPPIGNTGRQSAALSTSSLLEKYKKVFDFLQIELDFIKPIEQPLPSDTNTNDSIIVEPDVFVSWKKNRLLKPILVQQVPEPQAALPATMATPAIKVEDIVHEKPSAATTTTALEIDNDIDENTPADFNDIADNFNFNSITETPVLARETRKRKIPGQPLTARKSVGVIVPTTRKRRKVQKAETSDILPPDTEDVFTLPTSQEPEDRTIKQLNLANVPVQVKKKVQQAQKAAAAAKLKAEKLEVKLLRSSLSVGAGEEKLKKKLAMLKEKLKKKRDEALAKEKKMKEDKKKKQEAKKQRNEGNKKYDKWEDRYKQLVEFYEKYGHCKVTRQMRDENNNVSKHIRALGEWVSDQRKYYRRKSKLLTQERIDMMNNIRFIWNPETYQKTFQMRVAECKKFKEKYGHLTVPSFDTLVDGKYPTEEEKRFRLWAQSIRHQYKRRVVQNANNKLDKLKMKALNDIGFDWGDTSTGPIELSTVVNKDRFADRINQLKMCRDRYGTCNERKFLNIMFPNDDSLYLWMKTQRKKYYKFMRGESVPSLSAERQKMLREVDFDFNPKGNTPNGKGATVSRIPNDNTPDQFSPIPIPVAYNETRDLDDNHNENFYR